MKIEDRELRMEVGEGKIGRAKRFALPVKETLGSIRLLQAIAGSYRVLWLIPGKISFA
jgi:hypothetical protein